MSKQMTSSNLQETDQISQISCRRTVIVCAYLVLAFQPPLEPAVTTNAMNAEKHLACTCIVGMTRNSSKTQWLKLILMLKSMMERVDVDDIDIKEDITRKQYSMAQQQQPACGA
eukprot:1218889-Amphidinium_carterae.2